MANTWRKGWNEIILMTNFSLTLFQSIYCFANKSALEELALLQTVPFLKTSSCAETNNEEDYHTQAKLIDKYDVNK